MEGNIMKINHVLPIIVPISELYANDYNPNRMPAMEMTLLEQCITTYGFLFPLVVVRDHDKGMYRIVDGYHRFETLKRMGATDVMVVVLQITLAQAVQLTVLMNRIKGMHQVEKMSDLVVKLESLGLEDSEICTNLGMEAEEYIRLKQQLGISHAFRNHEYNNSWNIGK
jgi:ParB-like chromosome segregation protein Spo0J